jgi:hypothetical protein
VSALRRARISARSSALESVRGRLSPWGACISRAFRAILTDSRAAVKAANPRRALRAGNRRTDAQICSEGTRQRDVRSNDRWYAGRFLGDWPGSGLNDSDVVMRAGTEACRKQ